MERGFIGMVPVADLHTHTIASGHAYCTIIEMARAAGGKGLRAIAITDHGPAMPHSAGPFYFANMITLPDTIEGVRVIKGIEANIIDYDGRLDLPERYLKRLELVIASLHIECLTPGSVEENTRAAVKALENPYVRVIAHPGNPQFPLDHEALVRAAADLGKCIEINNASFVRTRPGSKENCARIARLCKEYGALVVMNSDAHFADHVGDLEMSMRTVREAGVPEENVINLSMERVASILRHPTR